MNVAISTAVVVMLALAARLRTGVRARLDGEDGATTLEIVVIALGLLLAAVAAVAAITAAVNIRTTQIK